MIEQVIRALGALGDPSAVPAIEKRVKGSLFSRPPKGLRLAGLAALASIGTPHAVSLVEKARADKDPEISSTAAQLLSGKWEFYTVPSRRPSVRSNFALSLISFLSEASRPPCSECSMSEVMVVSTRGLSGSAASILSVSVYGITRSLRP